MKKHIYQILCTAIITLAFFACDNKEGDGLAPINKDAQPALQRMRVTDKDSTITAAAFGQVVALMGSGLEAVNKMTINGVNVELNQNYITGSNIIFTVPSILPTEMTDKLIVSTAKGKTAEIPFTLTLPVPSVAGMYNEFAEPGSIATVTGNYFYFLEKVTFDTGGDAEIISYTDTEIVIRVPDGAASGDRITVTGSEGSGKSNFFYRDVSMGLMDFDIPATSWGSAFCWGALPVAEEANGNHYGSIKGTNLPILGGYSDRYLASTCYFEYNFPSGLPEDYLLKFEINVQETWSIGTLYVYVTSTLYAYKFNPWNERGVTTNGWYTVSLNLSDFATIPDPDKDPIPIGTTNINTITDFRVMFVNDEEIPLYDISVDNFRLQKKTLD